MLMALIRIMLPLAASVLPATALPLDICAPVAGLQCYGDDIRDAGVVGDAQACCHLCRQTAGCKAWTWNENIDQHCWVKRACSDARSSEGYVSGKAASPPSPPSPSPSVQQIGVNLGGWLLMETSWMFDQF